MPDRTGLTVVQRWLLRHAQRHPREDLKRDYARLLSGVSGRVVEIGCGPGPLFAHYPPTVTSVLAAEINPVLRAQATKAAAAESVPIEVIDYTASLPDHSADVVVCCEVLCSASDPQGLLAQAYRLLRPGGELRVYEHGLADHRVGRLAQRTVDVLGWPQMLGGCHASRDIVAMVRLSGFVWTGYQRVWCSRLPVTWPIGPHVLGVAMRP